MNTKSFDKGAHGDVCAMNNDTCSVTGHHRAICDACHRSSVDIVMILVSVYMILFGFIGMAGSCGYYLKDNFGFLKSQFGRGFFIFFIGTLAVAQGVNFEYSEKYTMTIGIIDTLLGFVIMVSYFCLVTDAD